MDIQKEIKLLKEQNKFLYEELKDARNSINVLYTEIDRLDFPIKYETIDIQKHLLYKRGEADEKRYKEEWESL